ncbi:MAG: hypothetical protein F4Y08_15265 [Caldilineaceae bacterium SB0662_bin_9]|uniref:Uncharacterized protein n=1 Tax=Caldilineaceae bacterium SB0662_bin_9 TaxID=2605258 RepID=A0A6B1DXP1_9CHLR|nr:hypothetical protein [Caldilineaceae bacterium SB0662_bin_9]
MATKAQREARRRYALKRIRDLTQPSKLAMEDIADVLNDRQIPTPLGTTEWTARLVAALLICDAFEYDSNWSGNNSDWSENIDGAVLLWTLNSKDALKFFDISTERGAHWEYYWNNGHYLVGAFRALYGELHLTENARAWELLEYADVGSITADAMVSLPPEVEAYRNFALDVVKELRDRPWSYSAIASLLTRRGIPTPDGKTTWRHNQIERLIATSGSLSLMQLVTSQTANTYEGLERLEQQTSDAEQQASDAEQQASDAEQAEWDQDVPF